MHSYRSSRPTRLVGAFAVTAILACAARTDQTLAPGVQSMLAHISADSMKGHVSFLASDLLQGRATPSPGLDIAGEYIAAQFRRTGLEPAGDDGYFQTAKFITLEQNPEGFHLNVDGAKATISATAADVRLQLSSALDLADVAGLKVAIDDPVAAAALKPEQTTGKVLLIYAPDLQNVNRASVYRTLTALRKLKPAVVIAVGPGADRLAARHTLFPADEDRDTLSAIAVHNADLEKAVQDAAPGPTKLYVSVHARRARRTSGDAAQCRRSASRLRSGAERHLRPGDGPL